MKTETQLEKGCTKLLDGGRLIRCGDTYEEELELCEGCKATLTQTNKILKLIIDIKKTYVKTKVSDYSEGFSNGWISALDKVETKIKGEENGKNNN